MKANDAIAKLLFRVGSEVVTEAKEEAPYKTGNLQRDIQVFRGISKDTVEIGNSSIASYAAFVHNGTKPHKIRAKRKKALKTPFGVFKSVNHPGIKANPYLLNGLNNYVGNGGLDRAMNNCANEICEDAFELFKKSF